MQGLPTNLLTPNVAKTTSKVDSALPAGANGKVGESAASESNNSFLSLFANLVGNEAKAGKEGEVVTSVETAVSPESKVDVLLKNKDQEKNKKSEVGVLSTDKALSAEVLKNIDNLIVKTPVQSEAPVSDKIATASTNLDQLLKTLKGENTEVPVTEEGEVLPETKESKNAKAGSALDFLLKESKLNDVGSAKIPSEKILQTNPEAVSKLGISSEDFISHMDTVSEAKTDKLNVEVFDPKVLVQKQMNQSMKAYGQKQNLLNDGIIKNTKDLAFKENKPKSAVDELKTPDMKIGADLSLIKEQFVPMMQKQESGQNLEAQTSGKVLDLSKINTSNTTEIIKRISDYVEQSQVANKDSLDLTVKHDSLGQFKIQVNKPMGAGSNQMDIQITTSTPEGHEFFVKHEVGLMKNLSQAGIQLSDLRIVSGGESMSFTQSDSRQSGNSQYGSQTPGEQMSFDSGDSSQGSQRRKELWQEARNQQRYGA